MKKGSLVMSIILIIALCLVSMLLSGCKKKKERPSITFEQVVLDLRSVRSSNLDVVLPGIYLEKDTVFHYYSVSKLDVMSFDERVILLDAIDSNPNKVYIVMYNKLKSFGNYISIEDTEKTGVLASTIIDLYKEVYNEELSQYLYSNGTELKAISITHMPNKVDYILGEKLDLTGLVISGTNIDNVDNIQTYIESDISGFDSLSVGIKIITVTIYGRVCTFTVNVTDSILSANFTFLRKIDLLKLKQYTFNATVANDKIVKLIMTTNDGGIAPSVITLTSVNTGNITITMDNIVAIVTIRAFDATGNQIGPDKVITL